MCAGFALAVHQIEIGGAALGAAGDDTVGNAGDGGVEVSHNLKTVRPELVEGPFFLATPIKGLPFDKLRANGVFGRDARSIMPARPVALDQRDRRARSPAAGGVGLRRHADCGPGVADRSEENTSELQSQMRILYAVFC